MGLPWEMFENRLRKMMRHYGRWARKQKIEAYRIYDRDVPQFPVIVERYGDDYVVSVFETESSLHANDPWEEHAIDLIAAAADVSREKIYARRRRRVEGGRQGLEEQEDLRVSHVMEGGLRFEIHLSGRLDTGLFLDHRITRQLVREDVQGKRFLNLFAYTGSFSVYAAAGGASSTTSVDLSPANLEWAARNMEGNGFRGSMHRFVESDVLRGLEDFSRDSFDVAVLDPPTFSRSRRMTRDFDIARDHPDLIERVLRLLSPAGVLYFSSNLRKFRIRENLIPSGHIQDITARTIPPDFRMQRPHACYRITKKATDYPELDR